MSDNQHRFIDVFETARTGQRVEGRRALAGLPRLAPMLSGTADDLRFSYAGHVDARRRCAGTLRIDADVPLRCDRCGATVTLPISITSSVYFVESEPELARIPVDDSDDEPLLGSRRFDLDELLEDELILACPISPRHPDCRLDGRAGLEPHAPGSAAGAAQEEGALEARRSFAALAGFKPRRH